MVDLIVELGILAQEKGVTFLIAAGIFDLIMKGTITTSEELHLVWDAFVEEAQCTFTS